MDLSDISVADTEAGTGSEEESHLNQGTSPENIEAAGSGEGELDASVVVEKEIELAIVSDESGETTGRSVEMEELTSPGQFKLAKCHCTFSLDQGK